MRTIKQKSWTDRPVPLRVRSRGVAPVVLLVLALLLLPPGHLENVHAQDNDQDDTIVIPIPLRITVGAQTSRIVLNARVGIDMSLVSIAADPVLELLEERLLPNVLDTLRRSGEDGWLSPENFAAQGLSIEFDRDELDATLEIPVTALEVQTLPVFQPRRLPSYPTAERSFLAVSVPAWARYRGSHRGEEGSVSSVLLRASPALHLADWVLENEIRVDWADIGEESEPDVTVDQNRLVRTWEDSGIRVQAGQFSRFTRGLQSPLPVLGVSLDNLQADSDRTLVPALFDRPLIIDESGRIEVFFNGRRTRSFPIQPGQYELTQFPVTPGINTVQIWYVRDDGETDTYELIIPHAGSLLEPGRTQYAVALGFEEDEEEELLELPTGSGFFRLGLGDILTGGALLEATARGGQAGLELVSATRFGEPALSVYGSIDADENPGWAAQAGYRFNLPIQPWVPVFSTTVEYKNPDFFTSAATADSARQSWQVSSTVSQTLPGRVGLSVGHVHRSYHDETTDPSSLLYAAVSRSLGRRFTLRINGSVNLADPEEQWGASVTITSRSLQGGLLGTATVNVREQTAGLSGTATRSGPTDLSVSARAREIALDAGTVAGFSASARAAAPRFELTGSGSVSLSEGDTLIDQEYSSGTYTVQAGSGLYYAGGVLGVGAPQRGSFALVRPDRRLPTSTIAVRSGNRSTARESDWLGPVVLGSLAPGSRQPISVDLPGLPADYSLGRTEYIIASGYRSGTAITIVPEQRLYVRSRLLDARGEPVVYAGVSVTPLFEPPQEISEIPFGDTSFTDEDGVFEVYDLIPGEYRLTLRDGTEREATLVVPDEPGPVVVVDEISLQGGN